jgi:hypothetical protein
LKPFHHQTLPAFLYDIETAGEILSPAAVLPEQFYSPLVDAASVRGVLTLMQAILEDAISCF